MYRVVGVLTMYDAWDIIVVISLTHATNGNPTHHAKVPCNEQTPPHLFFDFLKEKRSQKALSPSLKSTDPYIKRKISLNILSLLWLFNVIRISMKLSCSHFSTGPHTNLKFSPHFALFPLKDRTRSSLESKGSHTKRKKILSTLLSLSFPRVLNQNKENSLKLSTSHTSGSSH